jgi:branched-chain amino acid transport system permease protein
VLLLDLGNQVLVHGQGDYDGARFFSSLTGFTQKVGLAGALLAAQVRPVTPADLGFATAAFALLAVIIGGAGSLWGACLGAALVIVIRDALGPSLDGHGTLLLGVVFVLVVYLLPRGAAGLRLSRLWRRGSGR